MHIHNLILSLFLSFCGNWHRTNYIAANCENSYILIHVAKLLLVLDNMRVKLNEDKKRETIVVSAINRPPAILPPGAGNDCESSQC